MIYGHTSRVAVAQKLAQVICLSEGRWFDPWVAQSAANILGWDVNPEFLSDASLRVWMMLEST